jgi:hypothetical protein
MITITPRAESRGDNGSRWLLSRQARNVVSLALPTQSYSMSAVLRSANGVLRSHPPCPGVGVWVRGCVGAAVAPHRPDEATTAPLIDEPLPWESPRPPCSPRTLPGPNYRPSHTCTLAHPPPSLSSLSLNRAALRAVGHGPSWPTLHARVPIWRPPRGSKQWPGTNQRPR